MGKGKAWSDEEVATVLKLAAEHKRYKDIGAAIGRSGQSVKNYLYNRQIKVRPPGRNALLPTPTDFAERFATMSLKALGRHYGFSEHAASRMAKDLGLERVMPLPTRPKEQGKGAMSPIRPGARNHYMTAMRSINLKEEMTAAGNAARYLKSLAPTYRCDERGRVKPEGKLWKHGSLVLTDKAIVVRADEVRARRERITGRVA